MEQTLVRAAWVFPMDAAPVRDGGVVIEQGRIAAVGTGRQLRRDWAGARVVDLPGKVLLPGLVNAHTHLELSDCKCGEAWRGSFASWLAVRAGAEAGDVKSTVAVGVRECLRYGVTSVGDIARNCAAVRAALAGGRLCVTSYGEVIALGARRYLLEERLAAAADEAQAGERLRIGVSPHAPYTMEPEGVRRCLEVSRRRGLPMAMHLAESADEAEFLARGTGPFRELWESMGAWDERVPRFEGGPVRWAEGLGLLEEPTLLAHVNYCDDAEMGILARGRASVVYCPRTHAYFGHPPHRWREMREAGINVAVGTDSCASSPDLNLADELRLVHRMHPEEPSGRLWEMATILAARAIGAQERVGSLTVGKRADMAAFEVGGEDPLRGILESAVAPGEVWIAGEAA